jgi:hypothetical protein
MFLKQENKRNVSFSSLDNYADMLGKKIGIRKKSLGSVQKRKGSP